MLACDWSRTGGVASTPRVAEATPLDYFLSRLEMLSGDLVIIKELHVIITRVTGEKDIMKKNEIPPTRAREGLGLPSPRDFPRAWCGARVGGISFFFIMSFSPVTRVIITCDSFMITRSADSISSRLSSLAASLLVRAK